jgi:hypothetical protein
LSYGILPQFGLFSFMLMLTFGVILNFWQYVRPFNSGGSEIVENSDDNAITKRRKICIEDLDRESINCVQNEKAFINPGKTSSKSLTNMTLLFLLWFHLVPWLGVGIYMYQQGTAVLYFMMTGKHSKGICLSPAGVDTNLNRDPVLSLVKLTRSGLLLFTFPRDTPADTVGIVSNIMESLESGISKSPL